MSKYWKSIWQEHMRNGMSFYRHQPWFINPPESHPSEKALQVYEGKIDTYISSIEDFNPSLLASDLGITASVLEDYKEICVDQNHKNHAELIERLYYLSLLLQKYFEAKSAEDSVQWLREELEETKKSE